MVSSISDKPLSERRKQSGIGCLIAFCILFGLIGAGTFIATVPRHILRSRAAANWVAVPCTIQSIGTEAHSSDDSTTYSIKIAFTYTYAKASAGGNLPEVPLKGHQRYTGRHYDLFDQHMDGRRANRIVNGLRPGTKATCFVNPADPAEAVIDRGANITAANVVVPLVFVAIGIAGVVIPLSLRRKQKAGLAPAADSTGSAYLQPPTGRSITLRASGGPVAQLIGSIVVCLFWNGIVSFFVYGVWSDHRRGHGDYCGVAFLTPFVLVGLGIIAWMIYSFLAVFNPRPILVLDSDDLYPGASTDLSYSFTGRCDIITSLEISLQGREEATYTRGTTTTTDKNVFYKLPLVTTSKTVDISRGTAKFSIPPNVMHSFRSKNNKIIWTLAVHGAIAKWPDIKTEFPITIHPAKVVALVT